MARGSGPDGLAHDVDDAAVRHLATLLEEPSPDEAMEIHVVDAT